MFVPECRVPGYALSLLRHFKRPLGSSVGLSLGSFFSGWGQCSRELGCTKSNPDCVYPFKVNREC